MISTDFSHALRNRFYHSATARTPLSRVAEDVGVYASCDGFLSVAIGMPSIRFVEIFSGDVRVCANAGLDIEKGKTFVVCTRCEYASGDRVEPRHGSPGPRAWKTHDHDACVRFLTDTLEFYAKGR